MCVCVSVCLCVSVSLCVCVCVSVRNRQKVRQTGKQADKQAGTQAAKRKTDNHSTNSRCRGLGAGGIPPPMLLPMPPIPERPLRMDELPNCRPNPPPPPVTLLRRDWLPVPAGVRLICVGPTPIIEFSRESTPVWGHKLCLYNSADSTPVLGNKLPYL